MNLLSAESTATRAALTAGSLLRLHLNKTKRMLVVTQHDIKLALDVRTQKLIEQKLRAAFPEVALVGEEGILGHVESEFRWVVDPIDGTVNYTYGIPHACISIALQRRAHRAGPLTYADGYDTVLGVVYDPFCQELWVAREGHPARLNGRAVKVSQRRKLSEAIISIGFAKSRRSIRTALPYFNKMAYRVRKIRMMGAAALGLTYVASGRFDAYIEAGIKLWDIAAGGFIIERAGGRFCRESLDDEYSYRMVSSNGHLHRFLRFPS